MRKHQQKQLLELTKTLFEVNSEIKRRLSRSEQELAVALLAESQEFALHIGSFIEEAVGDGTHTVALLEEFCDALYSASVELTDARQTSAGLAKELRGRISAIEHSIKTELKPDKIEVAFFPYKASMWDSLESIWLAAQADLSCDAYVVPVPYYEKNPDGVMNQMLYEGNDYPPDVPITDWREYSVEERRPDIVFIHYAYDDMTQNYSIHPDFFAKNMREFCDMLIYVPYYVQLDSVVPEYNGYLPGIVQSDYVIVQSEPVRQAYIEQYSKYYQANKKTGKLKKPDEKIIALGSPKIDKVINSKKEDFEIPDAWRSLIFRPDGSARTLILYNTHMFAWIDGGERYFEKLTHVFDTFRNRDDAVLWWRPHPSTESNFRTLRPGLLSRYQDVVQDYKQSGVGIYDDTPDLHRAICLTDGYYGDGSSLVPMYLCTEKPVMYHNTYETANGALILRGLYDDGEYIWSTGSDFNALLRIHKDSHVAEYMGSFPGANLTKGALYSIIVKNGTRLYFAPISAGVIGEYDTETGAFREIPYADKEKLTACDFVAALSYKNYIFFPGFCCPVIMRYDTESGEICFFDDWLEPLSRLNRTEEKHLSFSRGCIVGNLLVLSLASAAGVVVFNMDTCTSRLIPFEGLSGSFCDACFDGEHVWLAPRLGLTAVKLDIQSGEFWTFPIADTEPSARGGPEYHGIVCAGDYVWLIPQVANRAVKIHIQTGEMTTAEAFQPVCNQTSSPGEHYYNYWSVCVDNDTVSAYSPKGLCLIEFSVRTGQRSDNAVVPSAESQESFDRLSREVLEKSSERRSRFDEEPLVELPVANLNAYIEYVGSCKEKALPQEGAEPSEKTSRLADGNAGSRIYDFCRERLSVK